MSIEPPGIVDESQWPGPYDEDTSLRDIYSKFFAEAMQQQKVYLEDAFKAERYQQRIDWQEAPPYTHTYYDEYEYTKQFTFESVPDDIVTDPLKIERLQYNALPSTLLPQDLLHDKPSQLDPDFGNFNPQFKG